MIKSKKQMFIIVGIFTLILFIGGTTYAIFNYTRIGGQSSLGTAQVKFDTTGELLIDVERDFPQDADLSGTELTNMKNSHKGELTIQSHTTLTNGIRYRIYAVRGDDITGKLRLNDENIKFQLTSNFNSGTNGFTVKTNNYANPTNLSFDNEGKALLSTGLVKDTSQLTAVTYNYYMWIDGENTLISSTTKRETLAEGNPSLADTTTGNTVADRYMKNDGTLTEDVTIFPARSQDAGKTVYTTNEFSNGYYNIKILVEAEDAVETGKDIVLAAIESKKTAETNSCNPVWIDDNGTANDESDDITYFSGTNDCVDMNYVWYSGKLWRITAIYPDGAMKLITENNITSISYNASGQVNFYTDANTTSYIYQWLNEDFYDTLFNPNNIIDTSKKWNVVIAENINAQPLTTNLVDSNVGLLNSFEYYNSYRKLGDYMFGQGFLHSNAVGYMLLNANTSNSIWRVSYSGYPSSDQPTVSNGVRPSIYIKPSVLFTGLGNKNNPYMIVGDKQPGQTNDLINSRVSGEYIKFDGGDDLYRIIETVDMNNNLITKIISTNYAENGDKKIFSAVREDSPNGSLYGYVNTNDLVSTASWYQFFNDNDGNGGTWYNNLQIGQLNKNDMFTKGPYYPGTVLFGESYKKAKMTTANYFLVGLPRYGEMFATQQKSLNGEYLDMWLINIYSNNSVLSANFIGGVSYVSVKDSLAAKPTLYLKSSVKILSGSGLENDPYVVGL